MNIPDLINGGFEAFGGFFAITNVMRTHRDKEIKGLYWPSVAFFSSWGYWNGYYYWHLDQWFSWAAGIALASVNTIWLGQIIYYLYLKKELDSEAQSS